jgi:hypothetical protein
LDIQNKNMKGIFNNNNKKKKKSSNFIFSV